MSHGLGNEGDEGAEGAGGAEGAEGAGGDFTLMSLNVISVTNLSLPYHSLQ